MILRRLLVEGAYSRAWRAVGFTREPTLPGIDLDSHLEANYAGRTIAWAQTGGAFSVAAGTTEEAVVFVPVLAGAPLNWRPEAALRPLPVIPEVIGVTRYLARAAIVTHRFRYTRKDLILYVAYRLEGVHSDRLDETDDRFDHLDAAMENIQVLERGGPYYELMSIGQALSLSVDAKRFRERVQELAS